MPRVVSKEHRAAIITKAAENARKLRRPVRAAAVKPERPKVVDLNKRRYANTVLHFFDKFERAAKREQREHRAEVEREARKKL